ncbi:endospore germination permease [Aeribacillus pallidus]|nr:endospore germination permease [Aeribacillus pallidus]
MLDNGKITANQYKMLVLLFTIGSSILVAPTALVNDAKQDAWIATIFTVIISILLVLMYIKIYSIFPNMTLVEICELLLGKWIGKFAVALFLMYAFILSGALLREIGDFTTTQMMPDTPIDAIHIVFMGVVVMATLLGLEVIGRSSEIISLWLFILLAIYFIAILPQIKIGNLQPILGEGMKPILFGFYHFISLSYLELIVFLMIAPFVNHQKGAKKGFLVGVIIGGILLTFVVMFSILVLGVENTARQIYPSYALARKIEIGKFFQRVEVIMAGIWFLSIFYKLTISFYAFVLGLSQLFKIKDYRSITLPISMMLIVYAIVFHPNIVHFFEFVHNIWPLYSLTIGLLFPLILLGTALMKKRQRHVRGNR